MYCWYKLVVTVWFCAVLIDAQLTNCTTPNGEVAQCKPMFACPLFKDGIISEDRSVQKFIRESSCGNDLIVCCGTAINYTQVPYQPELDNTNKRNETEIKEARKNYVINKLLPSKLYCGMQHTDDYFYNETTTSVDEFPWIVYIPLRGFDPTKQGLQFICVGVLINNRYALTFSDCASQYFEKVILGQYHKNQNISCVSTPFGEDDCTEPIRIEVEFKMGMPNGFMLLRLAQKVIYSDYVRPICLPLEEPDRLKTGDKAFSSGWGEEDSRGQFVKIKKRIEHTILDNDRCTETDHSTICATAVNGSSSICSGDDGGPLMYKRGNNWFVAGIFKAVRACARDEPFEVDVIAEDTLEFLYEYMLP